MQGTSAYIRMKTFKTEESCFSQKSREYQNQTQQQSQPQAPRGQVSNNYRSKRQFATLDEEFQHFYNTITKHAYFAQLNKHSKIRINKWLTKLSNISVNQVWKKNRNNYIKLIKLMFDCQVIIAPINCIPPERDLHKLTNHEINVIIDQVQKIVQERDNTNIYECDGNEKHAMTCVNESSYVDHQKSQYQANKTHLKSHSKSKEHHLKSAQKSLLKIPKYPIIQNQQNSKNKQNIEIKQNNVNTATNSKLSSQNQQKAYTNQQSQMKKSTISSQYFSRKARTLTFQENFDKKIVQSHETTDRMYIFKENEKENNPSQQNQRNILNTLIRGMRLLNKFEQIRQKQEFTILKQLFNKNQIDFNAQTKDQFQSRNLLDKQNRVQVQISNKSKDQCNKTGSKLINIIENYSQTKKMNEQQSQKIQQKSTKKKQKLSLMTRVNKDQIISQKSTSIVNKIIA